MYHHSFSCSLDSMSFSCGLDELNIVYATYGSTLSQLCLNNNDIYNQTFGYHMNSFEFNSQCDITTELQSLLSNTISWNEWDKYIESCNESQTDVDIFEIFYYCPSSNTVTTASYDEYTVYWFCLTIICLLSLILLCGSYYCCVQCIRCYQYHYFCFHFKCCTFIIKYLCFCQFCDDYNWFYYIKHDGDKKEDNKKVIHISTPSNRLKYNTVSEDRVSDKLRVSVHSASSWNALQPSRKASSLHPSTNTTPIPEENAVVITPIVYEEKVKSIIFNTPASIELSPISQTSHNGIDIKEAHPSSAYILAQITDNENDPDLILPSDQDDDIAEETEMLPSINHSKSKSNKRHKKYKRKKKSKRNKDGNNSNDSDEEVGLPTSTRVVFNRSKSNTKHDIALLLQHNADHFEYESRNRSEITSNADMSNVVMVSYDSSPDIIIDEEYMDDGEQSNGSAIIHRLTNRDDHSPLKLVKAATWNGRSSEIIELFNDILDDGDEEDKIGLYSNNSGHIFSASLEQYPLASELKTIKEISDEVDEMDDDKIDAPYIDMNELLFIQLIGRGSNSNIFHGEWKDASVSIKMYDEHFSFKKFKKELETFYLIGNHPHILTIYGYTFDSKHNTFGIIQQLMSHGSASEAVRKQTFNIVPILLMLKYACCGLRRMHEVGILHRQLAAKHILLDVSGKCCITNLSESTTNKDVNDNETFPITATTPPEVITNKIYTNKSDVYSLGMTAWEILTQRTPFEGIQPIDAHIKVVKENQRPLQHNIPDDIYLLLTKCWDINPQKRPSLTDIILDLNSKLYSYRLLARSSSVHTQCKGCKRPSLVPSPQLNAQRMPQYRTHARHPQLQQYYTYSRARPCHHPHHIINKTHPQTPISRSSKYNRENTPPPPLDINQNIVSPTPTNSRSYNGVKTPTLPMYSHSAISPDRGPPQPISPPPNGYNPANIILAKINSQSAAE